MGPGMNYKIKDWAKHQHYKDRCPPWIKLHFSLLSSPEWVMLDDSSRALAVAIMLLASRTGGLIDGSAPGLAYIQRVAYFKKVPDLSPLIDCGFLVPLADASECKQMIANDTTEKRRDREEERREARSREGPVTAQDDSPIICEIPLLSGQAFAVTEAMVAGWRPAYPAVNIVAAVHRAKAWCESNPTKLKRNGRRFITGWLGREQERGSPGSFSPSPWNPVPAAPKYQPLEIADVEPISDEQRAEILEIAAKARERLEREARNA